MAAVRIRTDWRAWVGGIASRVIIFCLSFLMATWPVLAQPNVIVPDGRTQTQLQTSGNTTNVTTGTVSGADAFNSFSQFGVGSGNTVNLQLPSGTQNLINLVHSAPAYVNGTLNSYANGKIGGNVYFADPYGFVVGKSGVVNVGSLNLSTPSKDFTDRIVGPQGQIDNGAVANLMNGSFPVSPDGNIRIYGRINAADGVRLTGQNVIVGGPAGSRARLNQDHATQFAASVNSKGLRSASGIVVRNGSIQIVAANNARVNSRLRARHGGTVRVAAGHNVAIGSKAKIVADNKNGSGGSISVNAGQDVTIAGYGKLSAKSTGGDAGSIHVLAGKSLTVESGAVFDASSARGNAGLVELSSLGTFHFDHGFTVNVAAPNGTAGTLLIDPPDVVIGDTAQDTGVTLSNSDVLNAVSALSAGATYLIAAGNFTLAQHGVIDTRVSGANSHSLDVEASNIEI